MVLVIKYLRFEFIFYVKSAPPPTPSPEKGHPHFPSNLPVKVEILSSPPLFENLGGSTPLPPSRKWEGVAHYDRSIDPI